MTRRGSEVRDYRLLRIGDLGDNRGGYGYRCRGGYRRRGLGVDGGRVLDNRGRRRDGYGGGDGGGLRGLGITLLGG